MLCWLLYQSVTKFTSARASRVRSETWNPLHDHLGTWIKDKQLYVLLFQQKVTLASSKTGIIGRLTYSQVHDSVRVHGMEPRTGEPQLSPRLYAVCRAGTSHKTIDGDSDLALVLVGNQPRSFPEFPCTRFCHGFELQCSVRDAPSVLA